MKQSVLDTSALVRFFTNDDPEKASKVKRIIETQKSTIPDVVFPELEYVLLGKAYNSNRSNILKAFEFLTTQKNISVSKELKHAVSIYKNSKLDIADCIIAASAKDKKLISFDKNLLKAAQATE